MLDKIKAIKKSLQNDNPLAALALALTLPDICGQIEYPSQKVGDRYRCWFDKYVFPEFYKLEEKVKFPFNGKVCYQLRCSYLHSGNSDVDQYIDEFKLDYTKGTTPRFSNSYAIGKDKTKSMKLDINGLCYYLCLAAEDYYRTMTKEKVFEKYSLTINCCDDKDFESLFNSTTVL